MLLVEADSQDETQHTADRDQAIPTTKKATQCDVPPVTIRQEPSSPVKVGYYSMELFGVIYRIEKTQD